MKKLTRTLSVMLALMLALGAFAVPALAQEAPAKLRFVFYGDMTPRRDEFFKNEFHNAVLEALNIDLTIEALSWSGGSGVARTMLASGEEFAVFCILSAFDWASKGYLAEISQEKIDTLMPNYLDMRGINGFECCKWDGKIYNIPFGCKNYAGNMATFEVRNDIFKKLGYDAKDITTYDGLMEVVAAAKEAYPEMRTVTSPGFFRQALNYEIDPTVQYTVLDDGGLNCVALDEMAEGDELISYYESDYFAKLCGIVADWQEAGYLSEDLITNPSQGLADWYAGNCLMVYGTPTAAIDPGLRSVVADFEPGVVVIGDMPKLKTNDYDWGVAISANDEGNVDNWLKLFDWMYSSLDVYNFCIFGVEGKDFEYNEDGSIHKLVTDSFFDEWFMSASKYVKFDPALSQEAIDIYLKNDEGSVLSKKSGFTFDSSNVSAEVAALTAVKDEFISPIANGLADYDENIGAAIERLYAAGLEKYLDEYQAQYSAWYATR